MILQNLTRAIREQNWFAVVLEFVIVIAGVVIGFQIQAWNAGRSDRADESRYLLQVGADLAHDLSRVDHFLELYASQTAAARRVIGYHETQGDLDLAAYYGDVIAVLYFEEHVPRYGSLDALLGSGDVALLRDARIVTQLLEISLRYEEIAKLQAHKYDDVREFLYATYGDTLDYAAGIDAWLGNPPPVLAPEAVEQSRGDMRIRNGLTVVIFNNNLLIEKLQAIRAMIVEAQGIVAEGRS
jgi:hypothetical protein